MAWVESQSASFTARHEESDADAAANVLDRLERFRAELGTRFESTPGDVAVVIHGRSFQLSLAHPWLPLARTVAAPASRRYFAGWFSAGEIHVLNPAALERRASGLPESRQALTLAPLHEYMHLVVGANNSELPPPFTPRSLSRYLRWTWLCEGAATYFSGQSRFLRPAILRRLREGDAPSLPPATRDAHLLGGTVFELLRERARVDACVALASSPLIEAPERAIERAFREPLAAVARDWRAYLNHLTAR